MASMSRATAYRRISHAVQADVHAILAAAGEHINAGNISGVASASFRPVEVPEPFPNLSLGQVASRGIGGGAQEVCDVDQTGDSSHSDHSLPVEPENLLDRRHRSLTQQDAVTDSSTSTLLKELDITSLKEDLRQWSLQSSVPHDVVTKLLKVLRSYSCLHKLPNSARALLSTPRVANVTLMDSEEDSLAIIHKSWLKEDHRSTFWPIERNPGKRRKLTMQGAKPTGSWIEVQCIVKRWANTYEKAQDKLNSLQYSSDTNSERELGRGKRKRQRAMRFGDDEDNSSTDYGDSDEYVQPRAPTPPQPLSTDALHRSVAAHAEYPSSYTDLQTRGTLTNDARHPDATLEDVERAAMTWFRHAAERLAAQQT
ncbi:hypothetical protein HPB49_003151 [Dermacentor silvarum]|uniref:Uncharacterized protein n=1 Tax=Dermacentor silvarum TaxID=543639 RepID=A0ACB8DTK8_DERSI|nr:hypothetical protein HPB49_003151 [Dermacentor silvarum]